MSKQLLNWKELYILALAWRGPIHGYEVKRIMAIPPLVSWMQITHSEIYHALDRLERRGLIVRCTPQRRNATPFVISDLGLRTLTEHAQHWLGSGDLSYLAEFNVSLKLVELLSPQQICLALEKRKQELKAQLAWVEEVLRSDPPYPIEHICFGLDGERAFRWGVVSQIKLTEQLLAQFGCKNSNN